MKKITSTIHFLLALWAFVNAQTPGSVDPSFGENGWLSLSWERLNGNIAAAERLPDGKLLLLTRNSLLRLNPDGSPDTSFGGGVVTLPELPPENTTTDYGHMAVQPDGKILLLGNNYDPSTGNFVLFMMRRLTDGSPDWTFGSASMVKDVSPHSGTGIPLIRPDGKIAVVCRQNTQAYLLRQYLPDGSPDLSFGTNGQTVVLGTPGTWVVSAGTRAKLHDDGSITLISCPLGPSGQGYPVQYDVLKFLPDGTLDGSFGDGGVAHPYAPGYISGVEFMGDGRILVFGQMDNSIGSASPNEDFVMRLLPNMELDTTFNELGIYIGGNDAPAFSNFPDVWLALQNDGKMVLGRGFAWPHQPTLYRLNDDGILDGAFGNAGKLTLDYPGGVLQKILPLSDDQLFVAGIFHHGVEPYYLDVFATRLFADEVSALAALEPESGFSIEPNPCRDFARVSFPATLPKGTTVQLWDGQGRCLAHLKLGDGSALEIPTSELTPGTYWLEVQNEAEHWSKPFLKIE